VGGNDHARFMHSHFGPMTADGLSLQPRPDHPHDKYWRNFRCDPSPRPGWSVDWSVEDRRKILPPGTQVHLRCTDLTTDAQAFVAEAWISPFGYNSREEMWIPRLIVRRQSQQAPLASTFVAIIEPYGTASNMTGLRRLPLQTPEGAIFPDANVAVEIKLGDGHSDLIVAADAENPLGLTP